MKWYIDCYCYHSSYEFPVNSYGPGNLDDVIEIMHKILSSKISGINEIRIVQFTKGLSPMTIDSNKRLE